MTAHYGQTMRAFDFPIMYSKCLLAHMCLQRKGIAVFKTSDTGLYFGIML